MQILENSSVFLLIELDDPIHHGPQPFLVGVPGGHKGLANPVVERVQFVPGDADDLRARTGLFELGLESAPQVASGFSHRLLGRCWAWGRA